MKIVPNCPYKTLHGVVTGINPENPEERYYFRTNKITGIIYAQRCPARFTNKQLTNQQSFKSKYAKKGNLTNS